MMKSNTGNVMVRCPYCNHVFRWRVNFPAWNEPFLDTYAKCPICEELFPLHDPHKYDHESGCVID